MKYRNSHFLGLLLITLLALLVCMPAAAQAPSGSLKGQVTDPSGAVVGQATVTITNSAGQSQTTSSSPKGNYEFKGLTPGKYNLKASAPGFQLYQLTDVVVPAGQAQQLDISFEIATQTEKVQVSDQTTTVDTSSANNSNTTVISGKDLDALSDDPDELQQDLEALAGPSAGPNGGQIYIDGFTNGQLPPKASIREVRINQNPFSAQYDRLGYGRIEVFTKPGMDKYHGQFQFQTSNSTLNARNPFGPPTQPDYTTNQFSGYLSGPLSKKASFFVNVERRNINDNDLVYAQTEPEPEPKFTDALAAPQRRTNFSPRLDYQLTPSNTLTVRYQFFNNDTRNNGVGQLNLRSLATNSSSDEHEIQISDTQVISTRMINETRLEVTRDHSVSNAVTNAPYLSVAGAFNSGGAGTPHSESVQKNIELQNYTSMALSRHFIRFGGRLRWGEENNYSTSNFNGSFAYTSLDAYLATQTGLQDGLTAAQIAAAGGGASQYRITSGNPLATVNQFDLGLYAEDDWRVRSNVTLSAGIRFETQNNISDHADVAPRVGIAWGLGGGKSAPKTVVRAGVGMFFDRVSSGLTLQANRFNGQNEQYTIVNCSFAFPCVPDSSSPTGLLDVASLTGNSISVSPTTYRLSPSLRTPYTTQVALTLERQFGKSATTTLTYLNSRGQHLLFTRNTDLGGGSNIYQYTSEGIFKQNQLIVNTNIRAGTRLSLFSFYSLSFANADTFGSGYIPSQNNNPLADYGRAGFDIRNRLFVGGTITAPLAIRFNPFIVANSGAPFNIVLPYDANGDQVYNDRPTFADSQTTAADLVQTPWGNFDLHPKPGQKTIPINHGTAKATYTINLRVSRTFGFGPKLQKATADSGQGAGFPGGFGGPGRGGPGGGRGPGGPGGMFGGGGTNTNNRRYSLTIGASARNVLNHVNEAAPNGVLGSPLFGQSTNLAGGPFGTGSANRRIELQMTLGF